MIDITAKHLAPLSDYLFEYSERNTENKHPPVAVGRYGIRTRESIYSKELASDYSKNKLIYPNTLTVGMGSVQIDIGILTDDVVYSVSPAYHTYRINGISPKYLDYCLKCRNQDMFYQFSKRGSRQGKSIDLGRWLTYKIPVYDDKDQNDIVNVLKKAEEIIANYSQQLTTLDTLIKARFVEMFGDPKNNPNNYPECQLSDYIEFLTSGSRGWAEYCTCDGSEWFITIKNVKDCRISIENMQRLCAPDNAEAKRTKVQEGDLLISITADLGRTGVVTKEIAEHGAYINQHLTCIRLNKNVLNPLFVAFFMDSSAGKEQFALKNQSAVKAGLNFNSINSLRLFIPPMDKQKEFVEFSSQVDKSKFVVQQALDKAQLLFDSLMQQYFG